MLPGPGPAGVRAAIVVPGRLRRLPNRRRQILSAGLAGFMPQSPHLDAGPGDRGGAVCAVRRATITAADKGRSARARSWAS
jgi:hypothetical protein